MRFRRARTDLRSCDRSIVGERALQRETLRVGREGDPPEERAILGAQLERLGLDGPAQPSSNEMKGDPWNAPKDR
jgi:hypothetical protein